MVISFRVYWKFANFIPTRYSYGAIEQFINFFRVVAELMLLIDLKINIFFNKWHSKSSFPSYRGLVDICINDFRFGDMIF